MESGGSRRFSKLCVKNFFTVVLILIYLLLTAVAAFLAYQTISEVLEKLKNPVMSVTYQEVDSFPRPGLYGRLTWLLCDRGEAGHAVSSVTHCWYFIVCRNRSVSRQRSAVELQPLLPQRHPPFDGPRPAAGHRLCGDRSHLCRPVFQ